MFAIADFWSLNTTESLTSIETYSPFIFLTLPSTIPATNDTLETAGGDLTSDKTSSLYDKWHEIFRNYYKLCQIALINDILWAQTNLKTILMNLTWTNYMVYEPKRTKKEWKWTKH